MSRQPIISLQNVWKSYATSEVPVHALSGVSLDICAGEFLAILGPSGSGKSTMLSVLGTLDRPTKGIVRLQSRNVAELSDSELALARGRTIGFVFQQFNLLPSLTARDNVSLPMVFQGVASAERARKAESLLNIVGLGGRTDHRPGQLSGGEQQRVAIARALANDPAMIVADEPTGNLDTQTGKDIMELLCGLHRKGKTVVMVTHDMSLAKHADRIVRMRDGQIVNEGVIHAHKD